MVLQLQLEQEKMQFERDKMCEEEKRHRRDKAASLAELESIDEPEGPDKTDMMREEMSGAMSLMLRQMQQMQQGVTRIIRQFDEPKVFKRDKSGRVIAVNDKPVLYKDGQIAGVA
jgi:hypothetical protein